MPKFKFENCTSKQYVREHGWIAGGKERQKRVSSVKKGPGANRRVRYLTFCAEGALDVLMLQKARVIKLSSEKLFDTVCFFDFAPQSVDKTQKIIEGATGFPADFFDLVNLENDLIPDDDGQDDAEIEIPTDVEEGDEVFSKHKEITLYADLRNQFPFDIINLDVERYVIRPSEQLPGNLLKAWDKILNWQKRPRLHSGKKYSIDQFTLFFTTKIGPTNLPEEHQKILIEVLNQNLAEFPDLKEIMKARFGSDDTNLLYSSKFDDFLKLAVPKALISRALERDWVLDGNLSYQVFEFDRQPPKISPYTMLHYVLHFCRCKPSMDTRIHPRTLPEEIRRSYNAAVTRIFATECADVDELKIPHEESLKQGLAAFGIVELASDDTS